MRQEIKYHSKVVGVERETRVAFVEPASFIYYAKGGRNYGQENVGVEGLGGGREERITFNILS